MITRVDHVMLVVADVEQALATFRDKLGLTARYGGVHPRGTHNALVHFPDTLGYLELMGPRDREQVERNNPAMIEYIEHGGGIWRVAVGTDDVEEDQARLQSLKVPAADIGDWNRKRPDGTAVTWRMFGLTNATSPRLYPFFIQWPPPAERVPDLKQAGFLDPPLVPVTGIERVTFAVEQLDRTTGEFERFYAAPALDPTEAPRLGGRSRLIPLDEGAIEIVQPTGPGPARDALDRIGPGAFRLSLASTDLDRARHLLEGNAVRVSAIESRDDGRRAFRIDPRDAHGADLEVVES